MNKVWTIEDMREFAKINEGVCFSTQYVNRKTKLHFGCKNGHDWWTIPYIVIKGGWCRRCANIKRGLARRDTIEAMQELAKLRDIRCLSTTYVNQKTKLHWECPFGHDWWAAPHSIKYRNGGCPECFSSIGENICRQYFEALFGKSFLKTRPAWLVNSKGNRQELDGYCEELKLAFEYNGQQHYNYDKWQFTNRTLEEQKEMDENKRRLCRENGINLIEVSYELPQKEIGQYILDECSRFEITVPHPELKNADYKHFSSYRTEMILQLKNICKDRGIDFPADDYVDNQTRIQFICDKGHTWSAIPNNIKRGKGCPDCANVNHHYQKKNLNIEQMQALGISRGGRCKSTVYVNCHTPLEWECALGHSWWAQPNNVKNKNRTWCRICANKKNNDRYRARRTPFVFYKELIEKRGGICLSTSCNNDKKDKIRFLCENGHERELLGCSLKKGCWCSICRSESRVTV